MIAFAHSKPAYPTAEWHKLEDHLKSTASLAQSFAARFAPCGSVN